MSLVFGREEVVHAYRVAAPWNFTFLFQETVETVDFNNSLSLLIVLVCHTLQSAVLNAS